MTDITNLTLEGVDTFILSHETSISGRSIEALTYLSKAIAEGESIYDHDQAYINIREDIKK